MPAHGLCHRQVFVDVFDAGFPADALSVPSGPVAVDGIAEIGNAADIAKGDGRVDPVCVEGMLGQDETGLPQDAGPVGQRPHACGPAVDRVGLHQGAFFVIAPFPDSGQGIFVRTLEVIRDDRIRLCVPEVFHELCQSFPVDPVIPVQDLEKSPGSVLHAVILDRAVSAVFLVDSTDDTGILLFIFSGDLESAVISSVVHDEDFDLVPDVGNKDRVEVFRNIALNIVCGDRYGQNLFLAHCVSCLS